MASQTPPPAEAQAADELMEQAVERRVRMEVATERRQRMLRKRQLENERISSLPAKEDMKAAAREAMIDLQRLSAIAAKDGTMSAAAFKLATIIVVGILYMGNVAQRGADWVGATAEHVQQQLAAGRDYLVHPEWHAIHMSEGTRAALLCYLGLPAPGEGGAGLFRDRHLVLNQLLQRFAARYLRGMPPPTVTLLRKRFIGGVHATLNSSRNVDSVISAHTSAASPRVPVCVDCNDLQAQSNLLAALYVAVMGEPPAWPVDVELGDEAPEGLADEESLAEGRSDEIYEGESTESGGEADESDDDQLARLTQEAPPTTPDAAVGPQEQSAPGATASTQPPAKRRRVAFHVSGSDPNQPSPDLPSPGLVAAAATPSRSSAAPAASRGRHVFSPTQKTFITKYRNFLGWNGPGPVPWEIARVIHESGVDEYQWTEHTPVDAVRQVCFFEP